MKRVAWNKGKEVIGSAKIEEGYPKIDAIISEVRESVIDECIEALPVELDWNEYQRRQFSTGTMDSFMYMTAYNQAINDTITNLNALKGKSK